MLWSVVAVCNHISFVALFVAVTATYSAVALLLLLHRLRSLLTVSDIELIHHWCVSQASKPLDCCSVFCVLATLAVSMLPLYLMQCFSTFLLQWNST